MITILNEFELNFIKFLNEKHFTDKIVKLSILHNYETVGGEPEEEQDGETMGFACYMPELRTIMLPTKIPDEVLDLDYKEFIIHNLAHEYKHFLQDINNQKFDEDEADKFADEIVSEYISILGE